MLAYDAPSSSLTTRLGAQLPGLFRASRSPLLRPTSHEAQERDCQVPRHTERGLQRPLRAAHNVGVATELTTTASLGDARPASPLSLQRAIADAYLRYYDTAYWLRDARLQDERRGLLEREGAVLTQPLVEPVIPFDGVVTIADACSDAGLPEEVARTLGRMLFGADESSSCASTRRNRSSTRSSQRRADGDTPSSPRGRALGRPRASCCPFSRDFLRRRQAGPSQSPSTDGGRLGHRSPGGQHETHRRGQLPHERSCSIPLMRWSRTRYLGCDKP